MSMSSMLSAPAAIPATRHITFDPGFAPVVRCSSDNRGRPTLSASRMAGTSPADTSRFGSSNDADSAAGV